LGRWVLLLVFRRGDLHRVLDPGTHWIPWRAIGRDRLEVHSILEPAFRHELVPVLVRNRRLAERLAVIDLAGHERAVVWIDERLAGVLGPGLHATWTRDRTVRVETSDVRETPRVPDGLALVLRRSPLARGLVECLEVPAGHRGVLLRDGAFVDVVEPGGHRSWQVGVRTRVALVDVRERRAEVCGQDVITADRVTVRLTLVVASRVRDDRTAWTTFDDVDQALYRASQLALRAAIGGRTLEGLLGDRNDVAEEVRAALVRRFEAAGVEIRGVGLRDVILPGEMRSLLNRVVEARQEAEANLIRRREETAAVRSEANTARLLEANPVLLRLRELETMGRVLGGARLTVFTGGDGLAGHLRGLLAENGPVNGEAATVGEG